LLAKEWDDAYLRAAVVSSLNGAKFRACLPYLVNGEKQNNLPPGLIEALPEWALALDAPDACREILEFAFRDEQGRPVEQLAIAAATLRALRERNLDLTSIELKDSAKLLAQLRGTAEKSLRDDAAAIPLRLAALEIVSQEPTAESLSQIALAFAPSAPAELRDAAVARLVAMENTAAFDALLEAWRGFTPQLRGMALDECFERSAQLPIVLDALESGRIQPSDFDADRRQRFAMAAGADLRDRVVKALSADIQTDRRQVVEDYADVLRLTADAARGQEVFRNKCGVCHRLNNIGFAVGADLAALTDKSPQALLTAILDPNRALETKFVNYTAQTADGLTLTGMLIEESGASITLQGQEGKLQSIPRSQIEAFESTGKSLMPEGLEKDVSKQDLADVMAYVANVPTPHKEFPGNEPAVVDADESGALKLTAVRAEIFGPTLVFESGNQNLGFWGSEADRASWNTHVEHGGRYRVWLHYSCHDDTANNSFSVRSADQRVSAKVIGTGTWDYYRREPIGEFDLAPGDHRITIQSDGPIAGHLMDLFELSLEPVAE
jgi:putative heme-binding domain-containing protein